MALILIVGVVAVPLIILSIGRERVLSSLFGPIDAQPVDFTTLTLTARPNQYLVCPPDFCAAKAHRQSPEFDVSVADLRYRWNRILSHQPRIEVGAADEQELQYSYIQRSNLLRFPDSITVKFIILPDNRSTLAIYSRSHYGKSDLGVNKARIDAWLDALTVP